MKHLRTRVARQVAGSLDIFCGHPEHCPDHEGLTFVVSLDTGTYAKAPMHTTRIVRHIPNPFRGKGKPIDMSVVDMDEVAITAHMIIALASVGDVFFHCRFGRDRTGIVKDAIEDILSRNVASTNKGTITDEQEVKE